MGKLVLSHVKMMSSISSIKLVRNKSLVDIIVEVHHFDAVAPARERGLKYHIIDNFGQTGSRSREGAWIEINSAKAANKQADTSLPRGSVD